MENLSILDFTLSGVKGLKESMKLMRNFQREGMSKPKTSFMGGVLIFVVEQHLVKSQIIISKIDVFCGTCMYLCSYLCNNIQFETGPKPFEPKSSPSKP